MVVDYRKLNAIAKPNQFPIPNQADIIAKVSKAKIFSHLDLRDGFNNTRIKEGDEWKTAFRTKDGLFEYLVMPFGLRNAPPCFARRMYELFQPLILKGFMEVYIDNILVFSQTPEEHENHLRQVLEVLLKNDLFCNLSKCKLFVEQVVFLGLVITPQGISMDQEKTSAIQGWKEPK